MRIGKIIIYTDGSCIGNPGKGGYAGLIILGNSKYVVSGSNSSTTNNCMELISVIESINYIKTLNVIILDPIEVYTDSTYVMQGAMNWMKKWKLNNWRTSDKKDVANKDIWLRLSDLQDVYNLVFHWVKGHADNEYNNLVDRIARNSAERQLNAYSGPYLYNRYI